MKRNAAAMKAKPVAKYTSGSDSENESDGDSDGSSSGGEFSDAEGPEEAGNNDASDYSDEEQDEGDNYDESEDGPDQSASNVPLFKRLAEQNSEESVTAVARERVKRRRIRDSAKGKNL